MNTLICAIAKCENNYIREWIQYHKNIGISHIVIYDNNEVHGEKISDIISDYIFSGYCTVENFRGKHLTKTYTPQVDAYSQCYAKYNQYYDYIFYVDCDEFVQIDQKFKNIHDVLKLNIYNKYDIIRICWKLYDDNNLLDANGNYSITRFTHLMASNMKAFWRNKECKSIIRCKNTSVKKIGAHGCLTISNACNSKGEKCDNTGCKIGDYPIYDNIWLNHYRTKTIGEFIKQKTFRGDMYTSLTAPNLEFFFTFNAYTIEKEQYAYKILKELKNG